MDTKGQSCHWSWSPGKALSLTGPLRSNAEGHNQIEPLRALKRMKRDTACKVCRTVPAWWESPQANAFWLLLAAGKDYKDNGCSVCMKG